MAKQSAEFRRYAVIGAEQRLLEISAEVASIYRTFPELRSRRRGAGVSSIDETTGGRRTAAAPGRRRRRMSADARRRISEAQKARWAKQKAQGGGGVKKK